MPVFEPLGDFDEEMLTDTLNVCVKDTDDERVNDFVPLVLAEVDAVSDIVELIDFENDGLRDIDFDSDLLIEADFDDDAVDDQLGVWLEEIDGFTDTDFV